MMSNVKNKFLDSFKETRSGTVIQKYKLKVVAADEPETSTSKQGKAKGAKDSMDDSGDKGGEPKDGEIEEEEEIEGQETLKFNNFQDQIDYAVHQALINQSGVLVNTLTNMIKTVVDGTIAEHQDKGPVFLPEDGFPPYRNLVTGNLQPISNVPPGQPMVSSSTLRLGVTS